jgi:hypothetical protein
VAFSPWGLLNGARALDRLFQLEKKHGAILEAQAGEIQMIKHRLTKLEEHVKAREDILVAEAKGAAAAVGSAVAAQHVSDISRRLGALEERTRRRDSTRLSPPHEQG